MRSRRPLRTLAGRCATVLGKLAPWAGRGVEEPAKGAGGAVGNAAGKVGQGAGRARVPLVAGGAARAGMAGGIAFGNRQSHRHNGIVGLGSKELARAAKKAGGAGLRV